MASKILAVFKLPSDLFPLDTSIQPVTMHSTTQIFPFTYLFSLSFDPYIFDQPSKQPFYYPNHPSAHPSVPPPVRLSIYSTFNTFAEHTCNTIIIIIIIVIIIIIIIN